MLSSYGMGRAFQRRGVAVFESWTRGWEVVMDKDSSSSLADHSAQQDTGKN